MEQNGCIRCGDCCEFFALGASIEQIRADDNYPERDWILEHLKPAEKPERKANPLMSDKCFNGYYFYKCDLFDSEKRICKDYENRSEMCKAYPGKRPTEALISARCGYWSEEMGK